MGVAPASATPGPTPMWHTSTASSTNCPTASAPPSSCTPAASPPTKLPPSSARHSRKPTASSTPSATNSAAYTRLIKEIYYADNYEFRLHAHHIVLWDCVKDHPEQRINDPEKYKGNDIVVTRDDLKRVCIYRPIDRENLVYHITRSNILHIQKIAKQKKGNHEKENNH